MRLVPRTLAADAVTTAIALAGGGFAAAGTYTLVGASQFDEAHAFTNTMRKFEELMQQYYEAPTRSSSSRDAATSRSTSGLGLLIACAIGETPVTQALKDVGIILLPVLGVRMLVILLLDLILALPRLIMPQVRRLRPAGPIIPPPRPAAPPPAGRHLAG